MSGAITWATRRASLSGCASLTPTYLALVLMACPAIANAQSFRCRSELINVGDTKAAVLLKCGEPMTRDAFCKPVNARRRGDPEVVPCETVEEWTYDPGYGQFLTTLRFESGRLQAISYGERSR